MEIHQLSEKNLLKRIEKQGDVCAIEELEKRALMGHPDIYSTLGIIYSKGYGKIGRNCERALEYLNEGIKRGSRDMCPLALANLYYFGTCVDQDRARAFKLTEKVAVNENNLVAASRLALMYEWGHGCEASLDSAARWMYIAWRHGSTAAIGQYARILIKKGSYMRGYLLRALAFIHLPIILFRGLSDPRNRIW